MLLTLAILPLMAVVVVKGTVVNLVLQYDKADTLLNHQTWVPGATLWLPENPLSFDVFLRKILQGDYYGIADQSDDWADLCVSSVLLEPGIVDLVTKLRDDLWRVMLRSTRIPSGGRMAQLQARFLQILRVAEANSADYDLMLQFLWPTCDVYFEFGPSLSSLEWDEEGELKEVVGPFSRLTDVVLSPKRRFGRLDLDDLKQRLFTVRIDIIEAIRNTQVRIRNPFGLCENAILAFHKPSQANGKRGSGRAKYLEYIMDVIRCDCSQEELKVLDGQIFGGLPVYGLLLQKDGQRVGLCGAVAVEKSDPTFGRHVSLCKLKEQLRHVLMCNGAILRTRYHPKVVTVQAEPQMLPIDILRVIITMSFANHKSIRLVSKNLSSLLIYGVQDPHQFAMYLVVSESVCLGRLVEWLHATVVTMKRRVVDDFEALKGHIVEALATFIAHSFPTMPEYRRIASLPYNDLVHLNPDEVDPALIISVLQRVPPPRYACNSE